MQQTISQVVIMAAGKGTRMRPLTLTTPKPMLEVAGKPILEHTLNELPSAIDQVIIIVGYLKEAIISYFGDSYRGKTITYVEATELNGTGAMVHLAAPYLNERFLVLNGDDLYCREDMEQMLGEEFALLAMPLEENARYSALSVNADGFLSGLSDSQGVSGTETASPALINTGLYAMNRTYFSWPLVAIKGGEEFGLPHTIAAHASEVPVRVHTASFWYPIGFPEDLDGASEALAKRYGNAR